MNGKPKAKEVKKIVKAVKKTVRKSAPRAKHAQRRGVAPTQNAFKIGWDSSKMYGNNYGLSVHTQDAYELRSKVHRGHERGENPVVKAWRNSQSANQFGQMNPKKDTIEPFDSFIGIINGSTGYAVTSHQINPGLSELFPLLSKTAALYERYNFLSLEFYLTPIVNPYMATGKIIMSCDLEGINESPPISAAEQENNTIHSDGMPYEKFGFQVAGVVRHLESWYVRTNECYPGNADPKLFDCGTLYIGTYGNHSTDGQCELRVRGTCMLMDKIQEPDGIPKSINMHVRQLLSTSTDPIASNVQTSITWNNSASIDGCPWTLRGDRFVCPRSGTYGISVSPLISDGTGTNLLQRVFCRLDVYREGGVIIEGWAVSDTHLAGASKLTSTLNAVIRILKGDEFAVILIVITAGAANSYLVPSNSYIKIETL